MFIQVLQHVPRHMSTCRRGRKCMVVRVTSEDMEFSGWTKIRHFHKVGFRAAELICEIFLWNMNSEVTVTSEIPTICCNWFNWVKVVSRQLKQSYHLGWIAEIFNSKKKKKVQLVRRPEKHFKNENKCVALYRLNRALWRKVKEKISYISYF